MELGMQNQIMGYDRTSAMFSPEGHLLQVEYAEKTVKLGAASIGMLCSDGVVIVSDKRMLDELMLPDSSAKIYEIDSHIAGTAAGILPDARILIEKSQVTAQQHRVMYDSSIDAESIIKEIANTQQVYTAYGGARPLAVNILIVGVEQDLKTKLFVTDVIGNYFGYKATAIGENDEKVKEILKKEYKDNSTIDENIRLSLRIFNKILGKNFDIMRFEVAYIPKKDQTFKKISGEQLKKYLK